MFQQQVENEFRNIKLKLKGPNRHSELQAVKALMAMSAQHNVVVRESTGSNHHDQNHLHNHHHNNNISNNTIPINNNNSQHSDAESSNNDNPQPIYGLSITMTEEEFRDLAEKEGIKDVIGEAICKLCGGLFSGPIGIALHMCPAMKRQTYRCDICGEDKWKTKANLHSHIKWCKKKILVKTQEQNE